MGKDKQRIDDEVMAVGTLHCLRFVVPQECRGDGDKSSTYGPAEPGVYFTEGGRGYSGPNAYPSNPHRKLTRVQALEVAAMLDRFGKPVNDVDFFERNLKPGEGRPRTYTQFVERWYSVLAKRIPLAIDAAEERRNRLREVRAALTGETD